MSASKKFSTGKEEEEEGKGKKRGGREREEREEEEGKGRRWGKGRRKKRRPGPNWAISIQKGKEIPETMKTGIKQNNRQEKALVYSF